VRLVSISHDHGDDLAVMGYIRPERVDRLRCARVEIPGLSSEVFSCVRMSSTPERPAPEPDQPLDAALGDAACDEVRERGVAQLACRKEIALRRDFSRAS